MNRYVKLFTVKQDGPFTPLTNLERAINQWVDDNGVIMTGLTFSPDGETVALLYVRGSMADSPSTGSDGGATLPQQPPSAEHVNRTGEDAPITTPGQRQ